jgi:hypothetical protein
MNNILLLKFLVIIHVFIIFILPIIVKIIYINDTKYDIYILLFMLLVKIHWFFLKGECILSYIEKKLVLDNYKLGDDLYCVPINYLFNINYIYKKEKLLDNPLVKTIITNNILFFYILYKNINSTNFNLLLVITILYSIISWYWDNKHYKYVTNLREKYKNIDIEKIPLSQIKLYMD